MPILPKPKSTKCPTKQLQDMIEKCRRRKCFEGFTLEQLDSVCLLAMENICSTNYKNVYVKLIQNKLTYVASIHRKGIKWHKSYSDVVEAAKGVDKKFLAAGKNPVNFKWPKKVA